MLGHSTSALQREGGLRTVAGNPVDLATTLLKKIASPSGQRQMERVFDVLNNLQASSSDTRLYLTSVQTADLVAALPPENQSEQYRLCTRASTVVESSRYLRRPMRSISNVG